MTGPDRLEQLDGLTLGIWADDDEPEYDEYDDDLECTHCGGDGTCDDGCDPLWYDWIHTCHACNGTGLRRDQVIF